ncbi:hypothetical protein M231_04026 [Tremella mesenterica]|uniref:Uncharacterized protein n=1 Tax=Tremella mesenterica TaxID=5217 RepID=A0A4Q1BLR8_TREME|nr:hypothetical protein M231_04026 [Tremella mesenterica]
MFVPIILALLGLPLSVQAAGSQSPCDNLPPGGRPVLFTLVDRTALTDINTGCQYFGPGSWTQNRTCDTAPGQYVVRAWADETGWKDKPANSTVLATLTGAPVGDDKQATVELNNVKPFVQVVGANSAQGMTLDVSS